jgi:hypothetical protein
MTKLLKYLSGDEIKKGDNVLFHREPGRIEIVAIEPGTSETDWFLQGYGGGVMILESVSGRTFVPADQIDDCDDLQFCV